MEEFFFKKVRFIFEFRKKYNNSDNEYDFIGVDNDGTLSDWIIIFNGNIASDQET